MVNFLRDVMIVVAIVATLVALAFYPSHEPEAHSAAHDIPVGVPAPPVAATAANVDTTNPRFEKR